MAAQRAELKVEIRVERSVVAAHTRLSFLAASALRASVDARVARVFAEAKAGVVP
ncbi:hypothetical protein ACFXOR_27980 [Streptomyces sp. NPDC059164]|uniref:hypothetical protein n=1 Tax=unclassified Streptomyces TaxID=2593676 RepID=UPI0015C10606|nr:MULTISPECIES: hypothetical protein [unclassified Streptomyces]QWQ45930.1 hypothetical protein KME66_28185 [Streptomyces sp. YPW6]